MSTTHIFVCLAALVAFVLNWQTVAAVPEHLIDPAFPIDLWQKLKTDEPDVLMYLWKVMGYARDHEAK